MLYNLSTCLNWALEVVPFCIFLHKILITEKLMGVSHVWCCAASLYGKAYSLDEGKHGESSIQQCRVVKTKQKCSKLPTVGWTRRQMPTCWQGQAGKAFLTSKLLVNQQLEPATSMYFQLLVVVPSYPYLLDMSHRLTTESWVDMWSFRRRCLK